METKKTNNYKGKIPYKSTDELITIQDFAKTYIGWRNKPVTPARIYQLISDNMFKGTPIDFDYVEVDKKLFIKK